MEGRLDDLLSRIAMETQEIRELEQQLTDSQILANEALQRDLKDVICGLQEYLRGLRLQAHRSQQQVDILQAENQSLQRLLEDAQRHCRQLEDTAPTHTQQVELSALWLEAQSLKDRQVELEAELLQLRAELTRHEDSSLQRLQARSDRTRTQLDHFTAVLSEQQEDRREPDLNSPEDLQLYGTRTSTQALQQNHSQKHKSRLLTQDRLTQDQQTQDRLTQDRRTQGQRTHAAEQDKLQRLRTKLCRSESRTRLVQQNLEEQLESTRQQLQDVEQEKDALQQELRSLSVGHQRSVERLSRKLRQLRRSTSGAERLAAEQLRSTTEQLKVLNDSVDLLDPQGRLDEPQQNRTSVEQLKAELDRAQSQNHRLRQKLDRIRTRTRTGTRAEDGGLSVPSLVSQGTQDSGLELQYLSSPDRGRHLEGECVCSEPAESDGSSRGGAPPPPPPPPHPAAGLSAGIWDPQTPPMGPTWLLCGPPAGGAALHCNIPEHRATGGGCVSECVHAERLEEEKKKLRMETKQLRLKLRQVRCVTQVCDEVECLEKTLLKRRAELREADRLLLEAQSSRHTARGQAAVLQLRLQDSATCLLEAAQHLRELQEEAEQLRRRRHEEEEALRSRHQDFQQLEDKIQTAADRLADLLSDCQEAQRSLDSLTCQARRRRRLWNQQEN
ncbi:centriolin isoform X3 [Kryptolebias marmoratus]|uniref:centriolin isoform X3 n=1 Tax=Kryptolebias marmoratus TaxID=37003 RepID=UPI0007F889F2|nr:centriolin isoform X3 [Kryptolebias marmoratus]